MEMARIEVVHRQRGQPRSYAPHTYEADIVYRGQFPLNDGEVRHLVQALVHPFTEELPDRTMESHFKPRLVSMLKMGERFTRKKYPSKVKQVWRVRVEIPFCD